MSSLLVKKIYLKIIINSFIHIFAFLYLVHIKLFCLQNLLSSKRIVWIHSWEKTSIFWSTFSTTMIPQHFKVYHKISLKTSSIKQNR